MVRFIVPDMTCGGCARSITKAIQTVDPKADVKVDVPARTVVVDSQSDARRLAAALAEIGYPAQLRD
jgi:copper chaperone